MALKRCQTCNTPIGGKAICPECFAVSFNSDAPSISKRSQSPTLDAIPRADDGPLDMRLGGKKPAAVAILELEEDAEPLAPKPSKKQKAKKQKKRRRARKHRSIGLAVGSIAARLRSVLANIGYAAVVHMVLLFFFFLITFDVLEREQVPTPTLSASEADNELEDLGEQKEIPVEEFDKSKEALEETPITPKELQEANETPDTDELLSDEPDTQEHNAPPRLVGSRSREVGLVGRGRKKAKKEGAAKEKVEEGARIKEAAEKFGGGAEAISSVQSALEFLSRHQLADGRWNLNGKLYGLPKSVKKGEAGRNQAKRLQNPGVYSNHDIGATSLALLCFLGADHTTSSKQYGKVIKLGLKFLTSCQESNGSFVDRRMRTGHYTYGSALAFLALAEAALKEGKSNPYRRPCSKAYDFFAGSQGKLGCWGYASGYRQTYRNNSVKDPRSDMSITGWVALAMYTAKEAGLNINSKRIERVATAFGKMSDAETGETYYADKPVHAWRKGIGMVGVGLTVRRMLSPKKYKQVDRKALARLVEHAPNWGDLLEESFSNAEPNLNTIYGWYYGSLGVFFSTGGEGDDWDEWNGGLKEALLPTQHQSGDLKGSWDPDQSWIGSSVGRIYSTAMACLTLEVYYRHEAKDAYRLDQNERD